MKAQTLIVSALAGTALAVVPLSAQAATQTTQPYTHLVAGKTWGTGGTYMSTGGDIKLSLSTVPKATEVLVEECEGSDLGDVKVFTKTAASHVLASKVAKGTCFVILFQPKASTGGYQINGTFSY